MDREKTPWLIVLMHAPLYNSNGVHYMEGESMRAAFETWFVHFKVDMVFAGHVHAYERSVRFITNTCFFLPWYCLISPNIIHDCLTYL